MAEVISAAGGIHEGRVIRDGGGGLEEWNRWLEAIAPCCERGVARLLIVRRFGPEGRAVIDRDYGVDR